MRNIRRVLLYSPYLHIMGGGERHILSIIEIFDKQGYVIDIISDDVNLEKKILEKLGMSFSSINVVSNFFLTGTAFQRYIMTMKYMYLFYVTDGSYFFSAARKNYIFAMYPQKNLYEMTFLNRLKTANFDIISNGEYTAEYIDKWVGKTPYVVHPYIDREFFNNFLHEKKETILSVGRFYSHLHSKRQDILIDAFKRLRLKNKKFEKYQLVLAGGVDGEDKKYVDSLEKSVIGDKSIRIVKNPSFNELMALYADAKIYWHAAGYGVEEKAHPSHVEHLGITPLEAMASGAVVFCHASGGPMRLIKNEETGYVYRDIDELVQLTGKLALNQQKVETMKNSAYKYISDDFSYEKFDERVKDLFRI